MFSQNSWEPSRAMSLGAVMGDTWSYRADGTPGAVSEVLWSGSHGRCLLLRSCTFSFLAVAPVSEQGHRGPWASALGRNLPRLCP